MDLNKKIIKYDTMKTSLEYVKDYIDEKSGKGSTKISEMEDFDNTVVATGTGDYIAMTKNTDGKWQEEDIKTEEYTEEELKALLGLTETELDYLSGVINDNVVETGKTWSSSKIFSDIVNVKQDKLTAGNNIRIEADGTISSIGNPINLYNKDTYYEGGDVCHYNNYVYICNNPTTGDFDPSRWVRLGDYLTALTEDDIKDMLALTTEQLDTLASIILDGEIRVDKTHSSSKIYADIQEAIQTAKDYTLKEIGKAVGASYSIVTTVDDMVDNKVIYLLLNGSVYDMYIVEEDGSAIKVGDLSVDLTNYYTKSEIDADFLKKSEAEGTYAKSETVTNHIDDTAIHMTQDEKDKILNKDDVVTVLNEDVTDEQIGSAKVVYEELNKKIDKASITTTVDANSTDNQVPSAKAIYNKSKNRIIWLPSGGDIIAYADSIGEESVTETVRVMNATNTPYGVNNKSNDFYYTIYSMANSKYKRIIAYDVRTNGMYMIMKNNGAWHTWQRVCTTSVADVGVTKINIINGIVNPDCNYQVKNGVCYIQLNTGTYSLGENVNSLQLATGLPIPLSGQVANTYVPWASGDASKQVILFVDGVGDLKLHAPVSANGCSVFTSFSYPVAE